MSATTTGANGATKSRNRRAKMTISADFDTVTFNLFGPNGVPMTDAKSTFVASVSKLPVPIQRQLAADRLRNKLMDSYSDPTSDVIASCAETYKTLLDGNWAVRGEGAERSNLFIEAYAEHHKMPVDAVRTRVNAIEGGDDADKKAVLANWRKHPAITVIMTRISAARAAERAKAATEAAKGVKMDAIAAL